MAPDEIYEDIYKTKDFIRYRDEIIADHQCGFRRNRSTIDQVFCNLVDTGEKIGNGGGIDGRIIPPH
jgi:hypothetical protein